MTKKHSRHAASTTERLSRKRTHSMATEVEEQDVDKLEKVTTESTEDDKPHKDQVETIETIFDEKAEQNEIAGNRCITTDENRKLEREPEPNILIVSHIHDHNNNATDGEDLRTKQEEMSVADENSRQEYINKNGSPTTEEKKDTGTHFTVYEDSMCSTDPGDRVIHTNLYGTDIDPNYQSPTASKDGSIRYPTAPQEEQQIYDSPAGSQAYQASHSSLDHRAHLSSTPIDLVHRSESSMSISRTPDKGTRESAEKRPEAKLTSFGGIFKQSSSMLTPADDEASSITPTYQQPPFEPLTSPLQGQQRYQTNPVARAVQHARLDDCNIAAEQLASELVKNYGGKNSEMISDMLKQEEGEPFVCGGEFVQNSQEDLCQYADGSQPVLTDVDLLNTPQQLSLVDELYHQHGSHTFGPGAQGHNGHHRPTTAAAFGSPQACSTPDRFKRSLNTPQINLDRSYPGNDVQLHGTKWTAGKPGGNNNNNQSFECSENPCQSPRIPNRQSNHYYPNANNFPLPKSPNPLPAPQSLNLAPFPSFSSPGSRHPRSTPGYFSPGNYQRPGVAPQGNSNLYRQSRPICHERVESYSRSQGPGVLGLGQGNMDYSQQGGGDITKMTFTPRQMMETHLSSQVHRKPDLSPHGHTVSEMDYSSIYPKREFIERSTGMGPGASQSRMSQMVNPPPKKRHKMTVCTGSPMMPPAAPSMPMIDDMMAKCPTQFNRQETPFTTRQKYHVLNPSQETSMTAKALLCKYIDFLTLENEQITEISKSVSPPVDIYVTEDMYFMDTLKYRVPFPSRKLTEWVSSFYPKLNFWQMSFKNEKPKVHPESVHRMVDSRPTQQILEDTFYFFQREIMNYEGQ